MKNRLLCILMILVIAMSSLGAAFAEYSLADTYILNDTILFQINDEEIEIVGLFGFRNLSDAYELDIPPQIDGKDVVRILKYAFSLEEALFRVTIPSTVKVIENYTFEEVPHLTQVIMEKGVERIGKAFCCCPMLAQVFVPSSVREIEEGAFTGNGPFFRLVVERNSYAEKYAREHEIPYCYTKDLGKPLELEIGNVVEFGELNGEAVEWYVLQVEEDKALLLARDIVAAGQFGGGESGLWYGAGIRTYMNDKLIYEMFDQEEGGLILPQRTYDPASPYSFSGLPGPDSYDKLFLLSIFEARELLPTDEQRSASMDWWLRTNFIDMEENHAVGADGDVYEFGRDYETRGIRPAMWIQTERANGPVKVIDDSTWIFPVEEDDGVFGVGDIIQLGSYEQDNDESNGTEPIEWIVLDIYGGTATLITKHCIDVQDYHSSTSSVNWGQTAIRQWLNHDFLNAAFSADEQQYLIKSRVENFDTDAAANSMMYSYMIDPVVSEDMVWLLEEEEVKHYLPGIEDKLAYPTKYAAARGVATNNEGYARWLLRTDKNNQNRVEVLFPYRVELGIELPGVDAGVRPVIRVDLVKMGIMNETEARAQAEKSAEQKLLEQLINMADSDAVLVFECDDYDGDGNYEAFGFVGTENEQGVMHGELWYVKEKEGRNFLWDTDFIRFEKLGASYPHYFVAVEGNENAEGVSHIWGVMNGEAFEMDWEELDGITGSLQEPAAITNLLDGDVIPAGQEFEIKWNRVDGAGVYSINVYAITDAGENWFWGDGVSDDGSQPHFTMPADALPAGDYRIQVSAWIGSGGHNDEALAMFSVNVHVAEGDDAADSAATGRSMGFITPEDGITVQAGKKLELEWTPIPGAQCYSVGAVSPDGLTAWWEAFYEGELSAVIPRSKLVEPSYQIELMAWKDDTMIEGREIFSQTITIYVHDKFADQ